MRCLRMIPRENIYSITGIQFLPFNTLYQLYAACISTPRLIQAAEALVTIPDLLNYWLSGNLVSEYTNATTTQFVDASSGDWATGLLQELDLPSRLLQRIVQTGHRHRRTQRAPFRPRMPARRWLRRRATTRDPPSRRYPPPAKAPS